MKFIFEDIICREEHVDLLKRLFKLQDRLVDHCWAEYVQSKNMPSHPKSVTDIGMFRKL